MKLNNDYGRGELPAEVPTSSGVSAFAQHRRPTTYEAEKQAWILAHPEATPEEYTAAMVRIARWCGV